MTKQDRLNLYKMIYDSVTEVGELFLATSGDKVMVLDINGNEFISGDKDSLRAYGPFIMIQYKHTDNWKILNAITGRSIETKIILYLDNDIKSIGDRLLAVRVGYCKYKLYNMYLEELLESTTRFGHYINNNKYTITYNLDQYTGVYSQSMAVQHAVYNIITGTFDSYCEYELGKYGVYEYKAVSTEKSESSIQKLGGAVSGYRYKLVKNGNIRGNKTYESIYRNVHSVENTFFVSEYPRKECITTLKYGLEYKEIKIPAGVQYIGIIDTEGNELIPPIARKLQHIGNDNFLLAINSDNYNTIFNLNTGIIYDSELVNEIIPHDTLPISIIRFKNGACGAIDNNGNIFDIRDIAKHLKCSYCKNNTSIIKVELEYKTTYITNRLVPITNMNMVSKLKNMEFIPMI